MTESYKCCAGSCTWNQDEPLLANMHPGSLPTSGICFFFLFFFGGGVREIELGSKPLSNNRHTWPHPHHGRNPAGDQTHEPEDEASQESDSLKNKKHVNT